MTKDEEYLVQQFHSLKLFESTKIGEHYFFTRVPGGWIAESARLGDASTTFIPRNDEFLIQTIVVSNGSGVIVE